MGIAYSGGHVEYALLRADTIAHLQADLDALLLRCGWVHTAITGGWEYLITSPQGLQANVKIWNAGDVEPFTPWPLLRFQLLNVDGSVGGQWHFLATTSSTYAATGYEAIAGPCQLFIALPGHSTEAIGRDANGIDAQSQKYAFACGIPSVPNPTGACAIASGTDATTDIWWACSKESQATTVDHFRSGRYCSNYSDYYRNGVVRPNNGGANDDAYDSPLQMFALTTTEDADFWFYSRPQVLKYGLGTPLYLTPFLGWAFELRGQLWDAFLASAPATLDSILATTETDSGGGLKKANWLAWNYKIPESSKGGGGTWFATLYLLMSPTFTKDLGNVAY